MNRTLKMSLATIAVTFLAWGGLNTSGFCFAEMRYVPDKEFFARYLDTSVVYVHPQIYQVENWTNNRGVKSVTTYRDGADFLAQNPDCCAYGPKQGVTPESNLSGPSFTQKFFGLTWGTVAVRNHLKYVDGAGKARMFETFAQHFVSPCGRFERGY